MAAGDSRRAAWGAILGLLVAAGLGLAFAWVAFGPGPRHCSASFSLGLVASGRAGGEMLCRGAFGVATLLAIAFVLLAAAAILRSLAPGRIANALQKAGEWLAILLFAPLLLAGALLAAPVWIARWVARGAMRSRDR